MLEVTIHNYAKILEEKRVEIGSGSA